MTTPIRPFLGFPAEGLLFLRQLKKHNRRDWFTANRKTYISQLLRPAQSLVVTLGERLKSIDPKIEYNTRANGSGSLSRIRRNSHLSKDSTPYKTHLDLVFWSGESKKNSAAYLGVRVEPEGATLFAGNWRFDQALLNCYQTAVLFEKSGKTLQRIILDLEEQGYEIEGERDQYTPIGFAPNLPRGNIALYQGIYALSPRIPAQSLIEPDFLDIAMEHFMKMAPLYSWLLKIGTISHE